MSSGVRAALKDGVEHSRGEDGGAPERRNRMSKGSETQTPFRIFSALWKQVLCQDSWKELLPNGICKLGVLFSETVSEWRAPTKNA